MSFITIILFFVYCYGLGFTVSSFAKNSENFLERNLMRLGFGLSILPFLALALNIIKIPADWRIILALSLVYPAYYLFRHYKKFNFNNILNIKITKTSISIFLMLLIFAWNLYIYLSGAFSYPYLEDDDSWSHAIGVKYISIEKNAFFQETQFIRYINPYPPSYDLVLGILHQTNDSVYWTMKFFNALIISLSAIFFYFFVKELSGSTSKALFATFALASIPSFLSHFIWAISLAVPLYLACFYALERIKHDSRWWIASGIVMAAILISTPTHSTYFGLFFALYLAAKFLADKKTLLPLARAGALGISLSFLIWWLPMILRHNIEGVLRGIGLGGAAIGISNIVSIGGTGDRAYSMSDFIFAKEANMINNPIGLGVVLSLLLIFSLVYLPIKHKGSLRKKKIAVLISFFAAAAFVLLFLSSTYLGVLWAPKSELDQKIPFSVFFSDQIFLIASLTVMIFVLSALLIAMYADKAFKDGYIFVVLIWLIFAFYAVNAGPYQFRLSPFRTWMLLAIPVCILAAEGANGLANLAKRSVGNVGKYAIIAILLTGIYFTSTQQKIAVNTADWPPGGFWTSGEELGTYAWIKDNLPKNSKVFTFVNNGPVIGMDMYTCHWCSDVRDYQKNGFNETAQENYNWLKDKGYEYLIVDGQTAQRLGAEETNRKIQELASSGLFRIKLQNQGAVLFEI